MVVLFLKDIVGSLNVLLYVEEGHIMDDWEWISSFYDGDSSRVDGSLLFIGVSSIDGILTTKPLLFMTSKNDDGCLYVSYLDGYETGVGAFY